MKTMLNRKNKNFSITPKNGYKFEDKIRLDVFRIECQQALETSKSDQSLQLGKQP